MKNQCWRKIRKLSCQKQLSLKTQIRAEKYTRKIYYEFHNRLKNFNIYMANEIQDDHTKINNRSKTENEIIIEVFKTMTILSRLDTLRKEKTNYIQNINKINCLANGRKPSITKNFYQHFVNISIKNQRVYLEPFQRINHLFDSLENPKKTLTKSQTQLIKILYQL